MTDENKQALEWLKVMLVYAYSSTDKENEDDKHYETIRAALQSKPSVDVEELVTDYSERFEKYKGNTIDYYPNNHAAMIGCMEKALHSQGQLNQGWRDIERMKLGHQQIENIIHAVNRCLDLHPEDIRSTIGAIATVLDRKAQPPKEGK